MKILNINEVMEREILAKNDKITMICFVFDEGKGLPNHTHNGMAVIQIISGTVNMNFADGRAAVLKSGDVFEFDARTQHNVIAAVLSKVVVTIIN
ncbi:MAG: cupin domain-containing protein [Oscillospiraceae bacterium]